MGRVEAIAEIKRAQDLEPLNLFSNADVGMNALPCSQICEAVSQLRKTIEIDPTFSYAHYNLALVYGQKGMYDAAVDEMTKAIRRSCGSRRPVQNRNGLCHGSTTTCDWTAFVRILVLRTLLEA